MKPRIKRRNADVRIFDILTELHGSYKAQRKYKYIKLRTELKTLNNC